MGNRGAFLLNTHLGGAIDRAGSGCRRGAQEAARLMHTQGRGIQVRKVGFCPEDLTLRPARIEK